MTKKCPRCREVKAVELFSKASGGRVGSYCKKCSAVIAAEWRAKNPQKVKTWAFLAYWSDPEGRRERRKREYWADPRKQKDLSASWARRNPKARAAIKSRYYKKKPEKLRAKHSNRDARRRANGAIKNITSAQWKAKLVQYNFKCAYCGSCEANTKDHVIPLAKGGEHSVENLVPACRPCNNLKRDELGWEPKIFPLEILV